MTVLLHDASRTVAWKPPLLVLHDADEPLGDHGSVIISRSSMRDGVKSVDGGVSLSIATVLGHIFLLGVVGASQCVVVKRALDDVLHALGLACEQQLVVDLSNADGSVFADDVAVADVHALPCGDCFLSTDDVFPLNGCLRFYAFPCEDVEGEALLPDV